MRRLVYRAVSVAAVIAVGILATGGGGRAPRAHTKLAAGVLAQSNSRAGSAILNTGDLGPGDSSSGTVAISNTGSLQGEFELGKSNLEDLVSPHGGALSGALDLRVQDLTADREIYQGSLGAMPPRPLGTFQPGESHTYHFTVSLPERGDAVDNQFEGARTTVQYDWVAREAPLPDAEPHPVAPPAAPARPAGRPPATKRAGPRVTVKVPRRQNILRLGAIYLRLRCDRPCVADVRVRLKSGARAGTRPWRVRKALLGGRTVKIKVTLSRRDLARLRSWLRHRRSIRILVSARAKDRFGASTSSVQASASVPGG